MSTETLIMILQLLAGLSIIVLIHELGHFLAARWFGMKVEKFYLFYDLGGVALWKKKIGGVEYGIGWLPLGGYVKIAGMVDESLDTEGLDRPPQPWEFRAKPVWQRLIVMVAGVVMNGVLGVVLLGILTYTQGEARTPVSGLVRGVWPDSVGRAAGLRAGDVPVAIEGRPIRYLEDILQASWWLKGDTVRLTVVRGSDTVVVPITNGPLEEIRHGALTRLMTPQVGFSIDSVLPQTPAHEAGLRPGDSIVALNGVPVHSFQQFKEMLQQHAGRPVTLTVWRNGGQVEVTATPRPDGTLGFLAKVVPPPVEYQKYGLVASFRRGIVRGVEILEGTVQGLVQLMAGRMDPSRSVQGPISIARKIYGGQWDWIRFWTITALLSLVIGLMNLLPIPALDGGHVILLLIELIRGKPLPTKALIVIQNIGMALLGALFIWIIFNDIVQNF